MISPTYEASQLAGGQLFVYDKPDYLFALPFLLLGFVSAIFFSYRVYKSSNAFPAWGILIFSVPFILAGMMVMRTGSLTLDRATNTANIHAPKFL